MGLAYTVKDRGGWYFITCAVHQWADVFTRKEYADILPDSIRFCQREKGLQVYCWVLMSNHIRMINMPFGTCRTTDKPKPKTKAPASGN